MALKIDPADISSEIILAELVKKRVLYKGHYLLHNGQHSDTFIYPRRIDGVFFLRVKLLYVLSQIGYDYQETLHLSMSHRASKIIRSVHDAMKIERKRFLYTDMVSGEMVLSDDQVETLRSRPFVIVDDVVRQGKALASLTDLCTEHQIKPVSVISAINSGLPAVNQIPIRSLLEHPIRQWPDEKSCSLCQEGEIPLYDPYHFERS